MEPAFASIRNKRAGGNEAYGVAYYIDMSDLLRLDLMETGYERIETEMKILPKDRHLWNREFLKVYTYRSLPEHNIPDGDPSPRYLGLITSSLK